MQILSVQQISIAADLLRRGEVVAFPTETVYGLGASIFHEAAIQKLFSVKRRPPDNPLIAHISSLSDLEKIAKTIPKEVYLLAEAFWPGPLSILLEARDEVPLIARAGLPTIAVRMPAHPAALMLIEQTGEPIVAPSANLSGRPSSTTIGHVKEDFELQIAAAIDGGPCRHGLESTVLDVCMGPEARILRPGSITPHMIERIIKKAVIDGCHADRPLCPGMKYRHYAPKAPIQLFYEISAMQMYIETSPKKKRVILSREQNTLSGETFYAVLRRADQDRLEEIIILCDALTRANEALYNRILKAAGAYDWDPSDNPSQPKRT